MPRKSPRARIRHSSRVSTAVHACNTKGSRRTRRQLAAFTRDTRFRREAGARRSGRGREDLAKWTTHSFGIAVNMSSSDNSLPQRSSPSLDIAPSVLDDDGRISAHDTRDTLASLLATATVALDSDRRMTRRCIQRAAVLLGIDLHSGKVSSSGHYWHKGLSSWQAERLLSYIDGRLDSAIRTGDLADVARVSKSYFFRAFRQTFGESPRAYITKRRMQRAQELMLTSRDSLAQVALECGMCDQAHFSRTFRRVVGTNPASWRRRFALSSASGTDLSVAGM